MREIPLLSKRVRDHCEAHGVDRYVFAAMDRDGHVLVDVGVSPAEPHFCQRKDGVRSHHAGRVFWDRVMAAYRLLMPPPPTGKAPDPSAALQVDSFLKTLRPPGEDEAPA